MARPPASLPQTARRRLLHVFVAQVQDWVGHLERIRAVLSPDEERRVGSFRRGPDRDAYALAHGLLRLVLERATGTPARDLRFDRGTWGKPRLVRSEPTIEFSLSHTAGLACVAVSRGTSVGVDVERLPSGLDVRAQRALATAHLPHATQARLRTVDDAEFERHFLMAWTDHEARLKAIGTGFSGAASDHARRPLATRSLTVASTWVGAVAAASASDAREPGLPVEMWMAVPSSAAARGAMSGAVSIDCLPAR